VGLLGRNPVPFPQRRIGFLCRYAQPRLPGSLPTIVRSFKSAVTRRVNQRRATPGQPVWQRNYYEHIIRNEPALDRIRSYIRVVPQ
jgi:REP element-mobilizing transposase RayT